MTLSKTVKKILTGRSGAPPTNTFCRASAVSDPVSTLNGRAGRLRRTPPGANAASFGGATYKDRYDPTNVFRLNHNIEPSEAER